MKCPISYSKTEILSCTKTGGASLHIMINTVIKELCVCSTFDRMVKSFVQRNGGNIEDAEDLIQESLSQLAISLVTKKYKGDSSIENYAYGICKFKWMNVMTKKGVSTVGITDDEKEKVGTVDIEGSFVNNELKEVLWKLVGKVSGHCPQYLKFWAMGYSHREIAQKMDVSEKRSRKNTSDCRQRLRNFIAKHPQKQKMIKLFTQS